MTENYNDKIQKIRDLLNQAHAVALEISNADFDAMFRVTDSENGNNYSDVMAEAAKSRSLLENITYDLNMTLRNAGFRFSREEAYRRAAHNLNRPVVHAFRIPKDFILYQDVLAYVRQYSPDSKAFVSLESAELWTSQRAGRKGPGSNGDMWVYYLTYDPSTDSTTLTKKVRVS